MLQAGLSYEVSFIFWIIFYLDVERAAKGLWTRGFESSSLSCQPRTFLFMTKPIVDTLHVKIVHCHCITRLIVSLFNALDSPMAPRLLAVTIPRMDKTLQAVKIFTRLKDRGWDFRFYQASFPFNPLTEFSDWVGSFDDSSC